LQLDCLTIQATSNSNVAVAARQFAIVDYRSVRFGSFPAGTVISGNDGAITNCGGEIWVLGSASTFVNVNNSTANLNCAINVADGLSFSTAFLIATDRSVVRMSGATITGGTGTNGPTYVAVNLTIVKGDVVIPGNAARTEAYGAVVR
jgi:hypothetical protein